MLLTGKTIVLGITGGIAAYKMPNVAHALVKLGADVHVLMTKNATEFISPLVFETLTHRRCQVDTFDRNFQYDVAHISLANAADLMLIAPATANVIAKMAHKYQFDKLYMVWCRQPLYGKHGNQKLRRSSFEPGQRHHRQQLFCHAGGAKQYE